VYVEDVNENPQFSDASFEINENHIGLVGQLIATDVDSGQSIFYSILEGNTHEAFRLTEDGFLYVRKDKILDFEREDRKYFDMLVEARDSGPGGLVNMSRVFVSVKNVNEEPFFPNDGSYIRSIVENTESHTLAGTVISSADEDVGDSRTYHIDISRGTGGDVFEVICKNSQIDYDKVACQAASAQLRLRDMKSLDFELMRSYKVYLVATDVGGLSASIAISINIGQERRTFSGGYREKCRSECSNF
jgi:hypothetical protein